MSAFNTCYKWAEENNVQTEDILTLKRLQENILKSVIRKKKTEEVRHLFLQKCREVKL
jgi:hypothetical protein